MNVIEFMIRLEEELRFLPQKKKKQILDIYRQKINVDIDLGIKEEDIIKKFKTPSEIAMEIYDSEGINFVERKKRQKRSNDVLKFILFCLVILLAFIFGVVILYYLGYSVVRLIYLLCLLPNAKEIIWMSLLVIPLSFFIILIIIYIIDLLILIINFFLEKIFDILGKAYQFGDFSIVDKIENKLNKPKLLRKLLIVFAIASLILGISNYIMHTYIYRSFNKLDPTAFETVTNAEQSDIVLNIDEAKVYITKGDTLEIKMASEFKKTITKTVDADKTIIDFDKLKYFDFLDFLKEPLPVIYITTPNISSIEIKQNGGLIDISNFQNEYLNIDLQQGNININDLTTNKLIIKTTNVKSKLEKINAPSTNLVLNGGTFNATNIIGDNITIDNLATNMALSGVNVSIVEAISHTGSMSITDSAITNLNLKLTTGDLELNRINTSIVKVVSSSSSDATYGTITADSFESVTMSGDVVGYNLDLASAKIETGGTMLLKEIKGQYNIKCLGTHFELTDAVVTSISMEIQRAEANIEYIKADYIKYVGYNTKSTLYFLFASTLEIKEEKGDLLLDNSKEITKDSTKYDEYYQKVEKLITNSKVAYRIESDATIVIE